MLSIALNSTIFSLILLHQPLRPFDHQKINHKSNHNCPTGTALQTIQWAGMSRLEEGGHGCSRARAQHPNMHWQLKELPPHTHTHIYILSYLPPNHTQTHWATLTFTDCQARMRLSLFSVRRRQRQRRRRCRQRWRRRCSSRSSPFAFCNHTQITHTPSEQRESEIEGGRGATHTMIYFSFVEFWICVEPPPASSLLLLLSPTERRQYLNIWKRQRKRERKERGRDGGTNQLPWQYPH